MYAGLVAEVWLWVTPTVYGTSLGFYDCHSADVYLYCLLGDIIWDGILSAHRPFV